MRFPLDANQHTQGPANQHTQGPANTQSLGGFWGVQIFSRYAERGDLATRRGPRPGGAVRDPDSPKRGQSEVRPSKTWTIRNPDGPKLERSEVRPFDVD